MYLHFSIEACWHKLWWILLFLLCCFSIYEKGIEAIKLEESKYRSQYLNLLHEQKQTLEHQKDLLARIKSQNDPDWIELTLMTKLGLAPEGQRKVVFFKKGSAISN